MSPTRTVAAVASMATAAALGCRPATSPEDIGGRNPPPSFATTVFVETVDIDTWAPAGSVAGPYFTTNALAAGSVYEFAVVGTHSFWEAGAWTPDCPHAEPFPLFPSPGTLNGQTAADPEYRFARPPCLDDDPPVHQDLHFQISLDGGATYAHLEPLDPAFDPDHSYTYRVTGQGERAAFRFVDVRINDNYGVFRATIEQVVPTIADLQEALAGCGIEHRGVRQSLESKLFEAQTAADREEPETARLILDAFIAEVEAQRGKHIAEACADALVALAVQVNAGL